MTRCAGNSGLLRGISRIGRLWQLAPFLALFFAGACLATAQQQEPNSYAGFQGRKVETVDVSAAPLMNTDTFRKMIREKPGQPFSQSAVRESIAALQQTKLFSQVRLVVTPQKNGLKLVFVLEPAYYIGLLSFPGAVSAFPYTRLLQAVNIPAQSAFTNDLLTQGQKALLHFFQTNGYFLASVTPQAQFDQQHKIVNLIFDCHLNKLARVGEIRIEGVTPAEAAKLRDAMNSLWAKLKRSSLHGGQKYSIHRIYQSVVRMRGELTEEHRLAPTIRFVSASYNPSDNRTLLTYQVALGPQVSIRITGAHLWKRTQKKLIPIYQEGAADEELIYEGRLNLLNYIQSKGFFDASVHVQTTRQPGETSIVYAIDEGKRYHVAGVNFQGNRHFDEDKLTALVSVKKGHFIFNIFNFISHGSFSNELVSKSVQSIEAFYKNAGFENVSVTAEVRKTNAVNVTFRINEGPQYTVAALHIEGDTSKPVRAGSLNLARGKPYSAHLLQMDRNTILARYFDNGYLNAQFKSSVTKEPGHPHRMDVTYQIKEGPQAHIRAVVYLGQKQTRESFIESTTKANVSPEQPLSQGHFYQAENELYNLGVFDWASVQPRRPVTTQTQDDVLVEVHESKRNTIEFGGGVEIIPRNGNLPLGYVAIPGLPQIGLGSKFSVSQKSIFTPRGSFEFDRRNILGRAETASIATILSRLRQTGSLSYSDPHFVGASWSSLASISGTRTTENPIFTAVLGQASFQVEKPLDARRSKNIIFRYVYQQTRLSNLLIPDLVLPQDRHVRTSTVAAEYIRDSRDNPLDAHRGMFQTFDFGITPSAFGSSADFVRLLGQNAFYIPARPWLTWANNIRLGFTIPFAGSTVPLSERFFSGGADSLRGFPINGAGPQRPVTVCSNPSDASTCTLISVPVGGNMLFILNSEGRFPLPIINNLGGVLFYDGGNVYSHANFNQFVSNYTNTLGVGLRYKTPVGPVRFDIGYRLTSIPGVKALQYFITLGQAF